MSKDAVRLKCGTVSLASKPEVVAGTFHTWTITYTVGEIGMDDGSRLKIAINQSSDWGPPQFHSPTEDNYCTVTTSGDATVSAGYHTRGYRRPWQDTIDIDVSQGTLEEGDTITLTLGDRSHGSLGIQAQSYPETGFRFRAFVDPFETEEYVELPDDLSMDIVPGSTRDLEAIAPSNAQVGEAFRVSIRAEDYWGNPASDSSTVIRFEGPESAVLPDPQTLTDGVAHAPVSFEAPGVYRLTAIDDETGAEATTNAVTCRRSDSTFETFWGDIHGQSGETVGTGTIREYFEYARDNAFLDFASHAGNDFQITDEFWEEVQRSISDFHAPHEFVTFLCYEWSANTPNGGDHNVYFSDDEAEIHRSSEWQTETGSDRIRGTYPVSELYEKYEGREDVMIIPHQGGRPATLEVFDPELTPFVEIVSVWGVFEWFGHEALERGYPVGFVGGTDDHTGRPGASTPANVDDWAFPIDGGLMGVKAESLTRDSLWDAFKSRRVFATTGPRIDLDVSINGSPMGAETTANGQVEIDVSVRGTAPIRGIDLFRGANRIATRGFNEGSEWIECRWTGARAKTRHKVQDWTGGLSINRGRITAIEPFGFDHPEQGIQSRTATSVRWDGSTAGNIQGLRMQVDAPTEAEIRVNTPAVTTSCSLGELDEGHTVDAGGVGRCLDLSRTGVSTTVDADITFEDREVPTGNHPYHVRVRQEDSEMAWSSPIFVTVE
jgi:hypothetical protein